MKSSFRIASMTLFVLSALLLSACASTTEAGVSADASGMEVNGSASTSNTTTTNTTEEQSDSSGTP